MKKLVVIYTLLEGQEHTTRVNGSLDLVERVLQALELRGHTSFEVREV